MQSLPLIVFFSFLISLIAISIVRKIYYRIRYNKRFLIIPRLSIKGISSIAMTIAISIAIIILLTIVTADTVNIIFRAWPGTRITLEAILIKIGGLLYGPFIGLFIGAITDLLTVALTAGVFHYGYLVSAMAFGLISGLISDIFKSVKNTNISQVIISTLILLATIGVLLMVFNLQAKFQPNYTITFMGLIINVNFDILMYVLFSFIGFTIIAIIGAWIIYSNLQAKNKLKTKTNDWLSSFIIIMVISVVCNALVNVVIMPVFDAQLSSIAYPEWLIIRSMLFIPEVIFNCAIIIPIYKIVKPKIEYDYKNNMLEDIKYPVYVD